jgi:hypothetical protein
MQEAVDARIRVTERTGGLSQFRSGTDPNVCVFGGCEDTPDGRVDVGHLAGGSPVCLVHTILLSGPARYRVEREVKDGQTFIHVRGELAR